MPHALILLALLGPLGDSHEGNAIYRQLLADGLDLGGTRVEFPPPKIDEGRSAAEQRKALVEIAGGERAADDLLRDSVTAPFVLKVRDETTKAGDPIRRADLTFVVHADLAAIDPARTARQSADKPTEVANMRIETALLSAEAIRAAGLPPAPETEWYAHLSARLLDRILVESTDHVAVSRTADSLVVASRSEPKFARPGEGANAWQPLKRDGSPDGGPRPYEGGASYTKITRLAGSPGTLVVEAHFAFVEPKGWFDAAPILRSKFAPIAQDQIRRLRREVQAARKR